MPTLPPIVLLNSDYKRLCQILDQLPNQTGLAERLGEELDRAKRVAEGEIPEDVVTMNSIVNFVNEDTGASYQLELAYPGECRGSSDKISILSPAGEALIGLNKGASIEWPAEGRYIHLKIIGVSHPHTSVV
ncbi:nucleoside diphosphate kinase regulator [Thalassolituus oleivorans]|uniref:Regulator of nucleoside diphosphate kinase n=1 Tax=Thalassolituus oleivorans MIL-1 TaxID=1298593 RepID=M5DSB1_9GAMM|nr:nucleoside diphosphate kinase regulator [Thalassolituus oleivorans]PCI48171.1 MAG: transcription elongation factor GreAB [Oceanospirillales bacterium]PHQ88329.1 MAG: transcription elongation factor GreAB [Thalassobium sp.]CCU72331.1 regulator of nucleoside diphosphate kinase [Thalassolituus oleivorans MIL-1]